MKSAKMLAILVLALGLIVCLAKVSEAEPMGTAWTYQGRLMDANKPADGEYDFQFKLFDDPNVVDVNQVGNDVNVPDVDVIDGYFTVELDFGSDVFDGNARWLETAVRPGVSSGSFTILSPRQELTPTPYAIYVTAAGTASDANNADRVDGYHAGNATGQVAVSNGALCSNLNADLLDGLHAGSFLNTSSDYGRSGVSPTLYEGTMELVNKYLGKTATATNSDKVDNYHAGNAASQVAVSNGNVCTNLNADRLDGQHGSYYRDWNNLTNVPAGFADGIDNDSGGDITAVYAGTGLSGGGTSDGVTLAFSTSWGDNRYVRLSSNQTIGGTKTFSNQTHFTTGIYVPNPGPSTTAAVYVYNNASSPTIWAKANASTNTLYVTNSSNYYPTIWARNEHGDGANCVYARGRSSSYSTLYVEQEGSNYAGYFVGHLGCTGTKPATVETQSYGNRNLYADESAEIYFFDRGQGQLTNGVGVINLDPMFLETVTINKDHPMIVQITPTADCKGIFAAEKANTSFTVQELQGGTSNATFDWEVAAKRKGYEDMRMERITIVEEPQVTALGTTIESGQGSVRIIKGE